MNRSKNKLQVVISISSAILFYDKILGSSQFLL